MSRPSPPPAPARLRDDACRGGLAPDRGRLLQRRGPRAIRRVPPGRRHRASRISRSGAPACSTPGRAGGSKRVPEAERVYFKRVAEAREAGFLSCPTCDPWEPASFCCLSLLLTISVSNGLFERVDSPQEVAGNEGDHGAPARGAGLHPELHGAPRRAGRPCARSASASASPRARRSTICGPSSARACSIAASRTSACRARSSLAGAPPGGRRRPPPRSRSSGGSPRARRSSRRRTARTSIPCGRSGSRARARTSSR